MGHDELVDLLAKALDQSAERLRAEGHQNPWPDDLQARDIVRLLREHSREMARKILEEHG